MAERKSPTAQNNARLDLERRLANAMTGVPEVDSLIAQDIRRKFLFGVGNQFPGGGGQADTSVLARPTPQPPNPFMVMLQRIFGARR